ncbi:hypothetical protein [Chryseobacterium sp. JM1]|uniref:hypothetical protein n=1 Tax=Chryseobacterium sp. JM1 TaxID=1233950 RepID=UPI0004E60529|nr:hypothetical protein [Chryseobacterium sp. JM1]KFF16483.1 hypothetical protein IW22_22870 [Chryseobacterium sp. JM1]
MKKNTLLCFLIFIVNIGAQTLDLPKSIQSPNASSLGKYGDIPMNLYTGRADVSVPIHTLNEDGVLLDINLRYDTGGVRVSDVSGWVGQNWALNAGGVITRTYNGPAYDEYDSTRPGIIPAKGYYHHHNKLNVDNWNSNDYMRQLSINSASVIADSYQDLAPDTFTFNFMGHTGKFFLGQDGEWKVSSSSNLKVIINMNDNVVPMNFPSIGYNASGDPAPPKFPKSIGKITVLDDNGNKYVFGGTMNAIEFTNYNFFEQSSSGMFSTAWYLTEVYNNLNQKIYSLEYERGNYQASFYNYNIYIDNYKESNGNILTFNGACSQKYTPSSVFAGGQLIIPSYLKTVKGVKSNISVSMSSSERQAIPYSSSDLPIAVAYEKWIDEHDDYQQNVPFTEWYLWCFYYMTRKQDGITPDYTSGIDTSTANWLLNRLKWRKLNSIIVSGSNINKVINFDYTDTANQRFTLNSILYDQKRYSFEYNNMPMLPASHLSTAVDHFGYYTGTPFNMNPSDHYASRGINPNTLQYGTLNKITYPTTGYSKFEYEPHTYSKSVNNNAVLITDNGKISGLRIKKISSFSDAVNKIEKEYLYTTGISSTISSGILLNKSQYYFPDWKIRTTSGSIYTKNIFSINSIIPLSNFSGTQIEYSTVIEKTTGNGYVTNIYNSYEDFPNSYSGTISPEHSVFDPKTDYSYKRGTLKLKQYYNQSGTKLVEEIYNYAETTPQKIRAFKYENYLPCPSLMDGVLTGNAYEIFYSDFNLTSKIVNTYTNNNNVIESESYNYIVRGNFGDSFLRSKNRITTNYGNLKEEYQYSFDKSNITPYDILTNRREFSVIKTDKTLGSAPLSSSQVDYAQFAMYDNSGTLTSGIQTFPQKFLESKVTNTLEEKLVVDKYDIDGHILKAHKANGTYVYYYYGYNNLYTILKIEGAEIIDESAILGYLNILKPLLNAASPDYTQIKQQQYNIINSLPNHMCALYTFKPNQGVSSIMNSSGMIEYYNYDNIGRLINVKDQNGKLLKTISYKIKNQ